MRRKSTKPAAVVRNFVRIAAPPADFTTLLRLLELALAVQSIATRDAQLIVLRADVLHQFDARRGQIGGELQLDRPGERAWIVERELVDERSVIDARPSLDRVQLLGVRCASRVEPELVVVADRIDDERVAAPRPD